MLSGTIKEMMEAEMDDHLEYEKSQRSDSDDYRNGYKTKRVKSPYFPYRTPCHLHEMAIYCHSESGKRVLF